MQPSALKLHGRLQINAKIRRYLDLAKLLDLLRTGELYFRRADGFADRLEGAMFSGLRELIDEASRNEQNESSDEYYRKVRSCNYVSCWTQSEQDNMALWQLTDQNNHAVALVSSIRRVCDVAAHWGRDVHVYPVQYIDHSRPPDFALFLYSDLLQYKHKAYIFESEVRFVIPHHSDQPSLLPDGIRVPAPDLSALLESIDIHPLANDMLLKAVQDVCRLYKVEVPIKRSPLSEVQV